MKKAPSETLERQWTLLKRIPRAPRRISTRDLHDFCLGEGYEIEKRTTERDLVRLSRLFPLVSENCGRTQYWSWLHDDAGLDIPGMTPTAAVVMALASEYLRALLPGSALHMIEPYFERANAVLADTAFSDWPKKVRAIPRGPKLIPPKIGPEIHDVISNALVGNWQFEVDYQSRTQQMTRRYVVNPLGIVTRNGIVYLVATLWDYEDVRQLALHRMSHPVLLTTSNLAKPDFNLETYVDAQAEFGYPRGNTPIRLCVLINAETAYHLEESPLAEHQVLKKQDDGRMLLEAVIADTEELRWWLLGFGDAIEIIKPASLRDEFRDIARRMNSLYRSSWVSE